MIGSEKDTKNEKGLDIIYKWAEDNLISFNLEKINKYCK